MEADLIGKNALLPGILIISALYGAVGHGGASGYLALLSLEGVDHQTASTTALVLNLFVAGVAFCSYRSAGHFQWRLTWPFLLASVPMAYFGGMIQTPVPVYNALLSVALAGAAIRMWSSQAGKETGNRKCQPPRLPTMLLMGGVLGLVSGIVGVGGGIFLSPLIILLRWADARQTSATSACFILANSMAGLGGRLTGGSVFGLNLWPLIVVGILGGFIGSRFGAIKAPNRTLFRILAVVLMVAVAKLFIQFL
jgi:uncharacterized membrane protein YfcA